LILAMEQDEKDRPLILRASRAQVAAWKQAAARASERAVARGEKPITYSQWVRDACMAAYKRGD
jgi:hypothetical protein